MDRCAFFAYECCGKWDKLGILILCTLYYESIHIVSLLFNSFQIISKENKLLNLMINLWLLISLSIIYLN